MIYSLLSKDSLRMLHDEIRKALDSDDESINANSEPRYGVRLDDIYKKHIASLEEQLGNQGMAYDKIVVRNENVFSVVTPFEFFQHQEIKRILDEEDKASDDSLKLHNVRGNSDWKKQADEFESYLDRLKYPYTKIQW